MNRWFCDWSVARESRMPEMESCAYCMPSHWGEAQGWGEGWAWG